MEWIMFTFWNDGLFRLPFLLPHNTQLTSKRTFFWREFSPQIKTLEFWAMIINELVTNFSFSRTIEIFLIVFLVVFGSENKKCDIKLQKILGNIAVVFRREKRNTSWVRNGFGVHIQKEQIWACTVSKSDLYHGFWYVSHTDMPTLNSHWTKLL